MAVGTGGGVIMRQIIIGILVSLLGIVLQFPLTNMGYPLKAGHSVT